MKVFVNGAGGAQGGAIARELIARNNQVMTISRGAESRTESKGLTTVPGDLLTAAGLAEALEGADAAVFTIPLLFEKDKVLLATKNFIAAAEAGGVKHVIFNTTFFLAKAEAGVFAVDAKVQMKALFEASKLQVTTIVPDVYLDNLAAPWSIPVILENSILPYPIQANTKVPFISHVDLAKGVVAALEKPELVGQTLPLVTGLFTGEEIAAAIGGKLGKAIQFVPVDPNDFEAQLAPAFGALAAKEISNLYRFLAQEHAAFVGKPFAETQKLLEVTPQTLKEWVDGVNWSA